MSRSDIITARRQQRAKGEVPGGQLREKAFPGKLKVRTVERNGKPMFHVDGFATVFERGYPMWDMFGDYTEIMDYNSLSESLAGNPDVAWLVNHRGVTMARTTNGTLSLSVKADPEGYTGLHTDAYLNPDRGDVRDIVSAIGDQLVDEMSFAFMLLDGEWNDDYTVFRITKADINRGDVSAVNYGANPFTSIQARTADILEDLKHIPLPALSRAQVIVSERQADSFESAALTVAGDARDRYIRASQALRKIANTVGYDGIRDETIARDLKDIKGLVAVGNDKSLFTRDADADEDPKKLLASLDAVLDEASDLGGNIDRESLPAEVAQVLDLVTAAEALVDQLMGLMGVFDPDDTGERSKTPTETREVKRRLEEHDKRSEDTVTEPPLVIPTPGKGKPIKVWQSLGNEQRLNELSRLSQK